MQTIKRLSALLAVLTTITLYGCNDPKAPTETNFRNGINQALARHSPAVLTLATPFPYKVSKEALFASTRQNMEALVKAGLLTAQEKTERASASYGGPEHTQVYIEYTLTEAGKKAQTTTNTLLGKVSAFQVGKVVVDQVVNFTEPQEVLGAKIVQVRYTYRLQEVLDWAKDPQVQAVYPSIRELLKAQEQPVEASTTLVLTNQGWTSEL